MGLKPEAAAVEVHIEELVLHGFPPADRTAIGDAVQAELGRLIAERGLAATPAFEHRIDGGMFQAAAGASAGGIGRQVARSVYNRLCPPPSSKRNRSSR